MRFPTSVILALTSLGLLGSALGAQGQERTADRVRGVIGPSMKVTPIAGESSLFLGGIAGLRIGKRVTVAGAGYALTADVAVGAAGPGTSFQVGVGYGGVLIELLLSERSSWMWGVRGLLGGGNAVVHSPIVRNELGSDNFFVAEPEGFVRRRLGRLLTAEVGVGYRLVAGVEDLPGVTASSLRGWTATFTVRFDQQWGS